MKRLKITLEKIVSAIFKRLNCTSIRWKLIFINLAVITPISVMTIFLFMNVFSTLEKNNSDYTVQIIKQINANIESIVNEMDSVSVSVSVDEEIQKLLTNVFQSDDEIADLNKSAQRLIRELKDRSSIVTDILVVSRDMKIVSSTYESWIGNYRLLGPAWINKVLDANGKKVLISGYQVSKEGHSYDTVMCLARSIIGRDGNILGMVMIEVSFKYIESICTNVKLGENGFISLLDDNGYAVYNTNKSEIGSRLRIENIKKEKGNSFHVADVNNEKMMIIYEPSKYTGMTVAGFIPLNEIFKEVRRLRNVVFLVEISLFVIVILISFGISLNISNPIIKMKSLMKRVEQGDFTISTEIKSNDEIGQLGRSFNIMVKKINELIDTLYKSRLREKEAELNELRAKINPHFLYNTLEIISMTAYLNNDNKVVEMLNALAQLFRYSTSSTRELISVKQEISHVDTYIYLQKISNADKFNLIWEVDENVVNYRTIGFILQPILENCIRHGFKDIETGGRINVSIFEYEDKLIYRIKDNGAGMTTDRLNEILSRINIERRYDVNSRIGLNNVDSRIKLLFGQDYGINIWNNNDKGVTVEVAIPAMRSQNGGLLHDKSSYCG